MAKICLVGEWHQAVVLGACLAEMGHEVTGVVSSDAAAAALNAGTPPVHEPGLADLLMRAIEDRRLRYTTSYEDGLNGAEFAYLALDTPVGDDDSPELAPVVAAAVAVSAALVPEAASDTIVIVSAQVPVGTCARLVGEMEAHTGRRVAGLAYVPEFLRLGNAIRTFRSADRFIVGSDDVRVRERVAALFEPLGRPVVRMDLRSAEMTKHACNAFLGASISFINEIADLCDAVGADVGAVAAGMRLDGRIGPRAFLDAGLGFAGGTLGRDLRALQAAGAEHGRPTRLADAALEVNRGRTALVRRQLERIYDPLAGLTVGVLGLTYKPGTSTLRRSAALEIIADLARSGVAARAYDPLADLDGLIDPPPFTRVDDVYAAADDADAIVLVTPWDGLDALDLKLLRSRMRRPVFIDTRNRFDPDRLAQFGFIYLGVGRGGRPEGATIGPVATGDVTAAEVA